jgi:hypothetical protein
MLCGRRRKILYKITFATGCEIVYVKVQRKNINRLVLDTVVALVGEVERRPRQTRITHRVINKG